MDKNGLLNPIEKMNDLWMAEMAVIFMMMILTGIWVSIKSYFFIAH